nr:EOG090X0302 [Ilyocryptus agilis]
MSIFSDFCKEWSVTFPGQEQPTAWDEDVEASLRRHQKNLDYLKLEVLKEEFYVSFLEKAVRDANLKKQETTEVPKTSVAEDDHKCQESEFVTVIPVNKNALAEQQRPANNRPKAPPKPPKQYSRSISSDNSVRPKSEDVVAWTKQQIQQLQTKQSQKVGECSGLMLQSNKKRSSYENVSPHGGRQDYENVLKDMDQTKNGSETEKNSHDIPVTDIDAAEYSKTQRETEDYIYLMENTEEDKESLREKNGTLKSLGSTTSDDSSSTGSLRRRLYANLTSLDVDMEITRPLTKRQQLVLQNFFDGEESYVAAMHVLVNYHKALATSLNSSQPAATKEEIDRIFFHVPKLYLIHLEFLQQIKNSKVTNWNLTQVAQLLKNLSETALPEYAIFLANFKDALETTRKASQHSPIFADIARRIRLRANSQQTIITLEDLLHKPVARIQRHVAVIQDLLDITPQDEIAYATLQEAQNLTKTFLSEFSTNQLQSLFPTQNPKNQPSVQSNRHLVKNGFLVELQPDGKRKQRHCFLFTDTIVCTKYKGSTGGLEIKWFLPLSNVSVLIEDSASKLTASALTNVASLRSQAAAVRTQMDRSGSDKQRKKLAYLEAKLLLDSPNLPLKFAYKAKGASKISQSFTFLLSSEFERTLWAEAAEALRRKIEHLPPVNLQSDDIESHVKACRTAIEPMAGIARNPSIPALGDVNVVIELDSYGHYFHKARTKMAIRSLEPHWEEDFNLELEGTRGLRVLVYEEDAKQGPVLRGKAELELSIPWLKSLKGPQNITLSDQLSKNATRSDELTLCLTLRYLSHELTMRRPAKRGTNLTTFGVPIDEVCQREKRSIPHIVSSCVHEVERRGLEELGIYRVSGLATDIAKLRKAFDIRNILQCGFESDSLLRDVDVHSVSGLLKLYLRQLPEALFTDRLYPHFLHAFSTLDVKASMTGVDIAAEGGARTLIQLFSSLPQVNQNVITFLLDHLVRVNGREARNKMSLHNLATIFGPTLMRPAAPSQAAESENPDLLAIGTIDSKAGLSLLAYCCYQVQDFANAASCYEQLASMHADQQDYKLHWAQSLYQAGLYASALKICGQITDDKLKPKVLKLEAAIHFAADNLPAAQSAVTLAFSMSTANDVDTLVNMGCISYKEENYVEALKKFQSALHMSGFEPQLLYNVAICHYKLKEYAPAIKCIADIIERGIRDHPELSVGMATEGLEVRSVGNTLSLHNSALVEAFNLKAATEYQLKNCRKFASCLKRAHNYNNSNCTDEGAREALTDMPPRLESEIDPVTLHNMALLTADTNPSESFDKLQFLLQQQVAQQLQQAENPDLGTSPLACPPETFANLLLLYCKYEYFDMAADLMAEHADLTYKHLSPYIFDFLEALIIQQTSPEEAFAKFDTLCVRYGEAAKIYWDRENYLQVEKLFRQSAELCGDADVWRLNVAHTLFMQENKFREATSFYEPLVKQNYDNILNVSAVVLANLCVCYLVTSQNEEAEELLRKLEKEEEQKSLENPQSKFFHLSIVNLVIGTLYCSKGNYEFGVSRVIKSLEPYHQKLGTDTWFYAKRCLMSLLENMAKHVVVIKDSIIDDIIQFLDSCQFHGKEVQTILENPSTVNAHVNGARFTVTYEARIIKSLLLQIIRN